MSRSNLGIIERGYIDLVYIHEGAPDTLGRIVWTLLTLDRSSYERYIFAESGEDGSLWNYVHRDLGMKPESRLADVSTRQIRRSIVRYFIHTSPQGWSKITPNAGMLCHTHVAPHPGKGGGPQSYAARGDKEQPIYSLSVETLGRSAEWTSDDVEFVYLLDLDGEQDMLWSIDTGKGLTRHFRVFGYYDLDDLDAPSPEEAYRTYGTSDFVSPVAHVPVRTRRGAVLPHSWRIVDPASLRRVSTPRGEYEVLSLWGKHYQDQNDPRLAPGWASLRPRPHKLGRVLYRQVDPAHDLGSWYLLSDMQAVIVTGANIPEIDGLEEVYRTLLEAAK